MSYYTSQIHKITISIKRTTFLKINIFKVKLFIVPSPCPKPGHLPVLQCKVLPITCRKPGADLSILFYPKLCIQFVEPFKFIIFSF